MRWLRATLLACSCLSAAPTLEVESVRKIWDQAPHSAFGDLIRFRGQWFAVFREGLGHVARPGKEDDGKLRVIVSRDGERWESAALVEEKGVDLRDPHLSITRDGRLMIVAGGSLYPQGKFEGRQPRVAFSTEGRNWTAPQKVLEPGHWLWRVTWHKGRAWGVTKYGTPSRIRLVSSADGVAWETVTELNVERGDETTVRFLRDGRMVALVRRHQGDDRAMIGVSAPPYREWQWSTASVFVGGPNFIVLPKDTMVAGGRRRMSEGGSKTALGVLTTTSYEPSLTLPSGGDSSYPGFVWHRGRLWVLYYSSHEGKTAIYLAKVTVR